MMSPERLPTCYTYNVNERVDLRRVELWGWNVLTKHINIEKYLIIIIIIIIFII